MSNTLIFGLLTMFASAVVMLYINGFKQGAVRIFFVLSVLALYAFMTSHFGQSGKEYLVYLMIVVGLCYLVMKKITGK